MTTLQNIPIVEGNVFWVSGLKLARTGNTAATVTAGYCRDSLNQVTMSTSVTTTLTLAGTGLNGLDTGTIAASTFYAVYMIADVQNRNATGFLISTNATTPLLPQGYSNYERIGWLLTDSSSHVLPFEQAGPAGTRIYQWDTAIRVLNAGTSATFAAFTLQTAMPSLAIPVNLTVSFTANAAGDTGLIRPTGSTETTLTPIQIGSPAASHALVVSNQQIIPILVTGNPSLDYIVAASGSMTVWVAGFTDYIGL